MYKVLQNNMASMYQLLVMEWLPFLLFLMASFILYFTSPVNGDFWWSDAPRHALNGVFYKDLFSNFPVEDIKKFSIEYYIQYPALTILFYPPFFPLMESVFYAIFGVSHQTAQMCVTTFYFIAGWVAYTIAKRWLPQWQALAVGILFMSVHEVALWGRQVMLEIPTYALLLLSVYFLFRYLDNRKSYLLYIISIVFCAGIYTKQTIIFILPAFLLAIYDVKRWNIFKDKHFWGSILLFIFLMIPLLFITLKYGGLNIHQISNAPEVAGLPNKSFFGLFYYLQMIPAQIGWMTTIFSVGYIIGSCFFKSWRIPPNAHKFFIFWVVLAYAFFTAIAIKEERHSMFILYPFVIFSILFLNRVLPIAVATYAALGLAIGTFTYTVVNDPVPYIRGYAEASDYVIAKAPADSVVFFSGQRDGSFIFNLRCRDKNRKISVLRADKLFLNVAVARHFGVKERDFTDLEINNMLNEFGVRYVVQEPVFWGDLKPFQQLDNVLKHSNFMEISRIPVTGNVHHIEKELIIYQNTGQFYNDIKKSIKLELPIIGTAIEGKIGNK